LFSQKYLIIIYFAEKEMSAACSGTYLLNFSDLASERAVGDVDKRANLDGFGQCLVGAGDAGVVTFDGVVGDNLQVLTRCNLDGLVVHKQSSADLGALGVQHDGARLVRALLQSLLEVRDRLAVRLKSKSKSISGEMLRDKRGKCILTA
jgi:hypothetical protein